MINKLKIIEILSEIQFHATKRISAISNADSQAEIETKVRLQLFIEQLNSLWPDAINRINGYRSLMRHLSFCQLTDMYDILGSDIPSVYQSLFSIVEVSNVNEEGSSLSDFLNSAKELAKNSSNDPFEIDELVQIRQTLELLRNELLNKASELHGHLDAQDAELREINARVKSLQETSRTMGKKDFYSLTLGVLFSLATQGIIPSSGITGIGHGS